MAKIAESKQGHCPCDPPRAPVTADYRQAVDPPPRRQTDFFPGGRRGGYRGHAKRWKTRLCLMPPDPCLTRVIGLISNHPHGPPTVADGVNGPRADTGMVRPPDVSSSGRSSFEPWKEDHDDHAVRRLLHDGVLLTVINRLDTIIDLAY